MPVSRSLTGKTHFKFYFRSCVRRNKNLFGSTVARTKDGKYHERFFWNAKSLDAKIPAYLAGIIKWNNTRINYFGPFLVPIIPI